MSRIAHRARRNLTTFWTTRFAGRRGDEIRCPSHGPWLARRDVIAIHVDLACSGRGRGELPSVNRTYVPSDFRHRKLDFTSASRTSLRIVCAIPQTLYLFDPQFHAGHFQILGAKTLQHPLIEECIHGRLAAQAADRDGDDPLVRIRGKARRLNIRSAAHPICRVSDKSNTKC